MNSTRHFITSALLIWLKVDPGSNRYGRRVLRDFKSYSVNSPQQVTAERIGSGIKRINDLIAKAKLPQPVIKSNVFFEIMFTRDPKYKVGGVSGEVITDTRLTDRQKKILTILANKALSPSEILAELVEVVTDRTLRRDLQVLKEAGYINNNGQLGPQTRWFLSKDRPGHNPDIGDYAVLYYRVG